MQRRDLFFKTSLTDVIAVFTEKKDKINAIISWHIRWFNSANYRGCMFARAQAEYGNKNDAICTIVREHKQWIQDSIFLCLGETTSCKEVAGLIMLILEGMTTYTSIFSTEESHFTLEKKYIFDLIENID